MPARIDKTMYDVAVMGAGFGGALTALVAAQNGCKVLLIEKGSHPRIVIGESTTPLTNLMLEEIARDFNLPFLLDFTQWGKWKSAHPDIRVGLKRGFGFYNHCKTPTAKPPDLWDRELMVAASPNQQIADTHWWREDWDNYLTNQAIQHGVTYMEHSEIEHFEETPDCIRLGIRQAGEQIQINARSVIDASGGKSGVAQWLGIESQPLAHTPASFSVYGHFENVNPWKGCSTDAMDSAPPYPPNKAAVHHLIHGGWVWSLEFDHGPVSAGAVLTDATHANIKSESAETIWQYILEQHPRLKECFHKAESMYPMRKIERLGYRMERMHGDRWIMLPSAAGFVDPLLSTGFPLTLQGIQRLGEALRPETLRGSGPIQAFPTIAEKSQLELSICDQLIGTLFATMDPFRHFAATTMLYFAAVSYTETAWRLGKKHLAPGFLFSENPEQLNTLTTALKHIQTIQKENTSDDDKRASIQNIITSTIEPFNVIGLDPSATTPWFPADMSPLFKNANKLKSTPEEIQSMLHQFGLTF
jgi:FADH2 O2-dependent halogenase